MKPEGSGSDDIGKRTPLDICCVLDVSGSMAASAKRQSNTPREPEVTVLDVVKHSVMTIIASMQEGASSRLFSSVDTECENQR
jgi:hypothetical protein